VVSLKNIFQSSISLFITEINKVRVFYFNSAPEFFTPWPTTLDRPFIIQTSPSITRFTILWHFSTYSWIL